MNNLNLMLSLKFLMDAFLHLYNDPSDRVATMTKLAYLIYSIDNAKILS